MQPSRDISRLLEIMARLRDPECGCPWDREQDFSTIAPYTIEEAYEVADAITRGDMAALKDELGDLLFQVVFHARMAEEQGLFGFEDVAAANLARKLDIDPEGALRRATAKFERRFRRVETLAGEHAVGSDLDALEALWQQVKREE